MNSEVNHHAKRVLNQSEKIMLMVRRFREQLDMCWEFFYNENFIEDIEGHIRDVSWFVDEFQIGMEEHQHLLKHLIDNNRVTEVENEDMDTFNLTNENAILKQIIEEKDQIIEQLKKDNRSYLERLRDDFFNRRNFAFIDNDLLYIAIRRIKEFLTLQNHEGITAACLRRCVEQFTTHIIDNKVQKPIVEGSFVRFEFDTNSFPIGQVEDVLENGKLKIEWEDETVERDRIDVFKKFFRDEESSEIATTDIVLHCDDEFYVSK